jgi:hypothetical protein
MMDTSPTKKSHFPSEHEFCNKQLSLFQEVLGNNDRERDQLSNSIDLWDLLPRYSISRKAMEQMRDKRGHLDLLHIEFMHRKVAYKVLIQPALVDTLDRNGNSSTSAYYPSASEELVEEALRKIAIEKKHGFFNKTESISGVVFSLYELREELRMRGHTRSYTQLKLSLDILSRSFIQIEGEMPGLQVAKRSTYFPELISVSQSDWVDDPKSRWLVRFHPLVTTSIENFSYRQFNYDCLMKHTRQLSRWIHRLLINKFTFASHFRTFEIRFSTIRRDSWLLSNYDRDRKAIEECDFCMNELIQNNILFSIERKLEYGERRKICDVVYFLTPTHSFVAEVKASGYRSKLLSTGIKKR